MNRGNKKTVYITIGMLAALPFFVAGLLLSTYTVVHGDLLSPAIGVFGGKIRSVTQCTCTVGHVISVGPPRSARVHFVPGRSILYEYRQIKKVGAWVLGNYMPPTPCLRLKCPCGKNACCCKVVPHIGDIQIVGTSR